MSQELVASAHAVASDLDLVTKLNEEMAEDTSEVAQAAIGMCENADNVVEKMKVLEESTEKLTEAVTQFTV